MGKQDPGSLPKVVIVKRRAWMIRLASPIVSCRSTRISASFDAWLRPSRTSQPNTLTMTKYIRRTDTNRDHASTRPSRQIAGHRPCVEF
jgi:hypothetical protein